MKLESLTKIAIEKRKIFLTLFILLALYGFFSYSALPKAEDPGFTIRSATVVTLLPGASPHQVENLITDKLEKTIKQIPEIEVIESESAFGVTTIVAQAKESIKDVEPVWDRLRKRARETTLPQGAQGPFVNDEFGDVFGTILTVSGEEYPYNEIKSIADLIRDDLLLLSDVAKVKLHGAQKEQVTIEFIDTKMAHLGLSWADLNRILATQNALFSAGELTTANEKLLLSPTGNFDTLEEIEQTTFSVPGRDEVISLKDIGVVKRGYADPPISKVSSSGTPAIALAISMQEEGNLIALGESIRALIDEWKLKLPAGLNLDVHLFQAEVVQTRVSEFLTNMVESILIVIGITLLAFGLKMGMIVASLIPLTILFTIGVMRSLGIGIDQISLASLIIALGMMVDNAVVMQEGILGKMRQGESAEGGSLLATSSYGRPLLISTLTTAAAFLPIYLAKSKIGEYTSSLFVVVSIALIISWLLALTWIPIICVHFLKCDHTPKERRLFVWLDKKYQIILKRLLKYRKFALMGFISLFLFSLGLFAFVPSSFFPPNKRGVLTLELTLPMGTHLMRTEEVVTKFEERFREYGEEIQDWIVFLGESAPRYTLNFTPFSRGSEKAYIYINTHSNKGTERLKQEIDLFAKEEFLELKLVSRRLFYGTVPKAPVGFRILTKQSKDLAMITKQIEEQLSTMKGVTNIRNDLPEKIKKIVIDVDKTKAIRSSVTHLDVAIALQTKGSGFITTKFRDEEKLIPIVLKSGMSERENIERLKLTGVTSQSSGVTVPLSQIADVKVMWEDGRIKRRDGKKVATILADLDGKASLDKINTEMYRYLSDVKETWPLEASWEWSGEKEEAGKAMNSLKTQIPIAIILILLLLMIKFNSFIKVGIVLSTIPLTLIGVVFGLILLRVDFGFMAFLGMVALAGIIINHAIVLLDEIELQNGDLEKAAGKRLLPIVISTLTAACGLLPLVFAGGVFQQTAVVIVFGLLFGSTLTLGFVPVLCSFRASNKV